MSGLFRKPDVLTTILTLIEDDQRFARSYEMSQFGEEEVNGDTEINMTSKLCLPYEEKPKVIKKAIKKKIVQLVKAKPDLMPKIDGAIVILMGDKALTKPSLIIDSRPMKTDGDLSLLKPDILQIIHAPAVAPPKKQKTIKLKSPVKKLDTLFTTSALNPYLMSKDPFNSLEY